LLVQGWRFELVKELDPAGTDQQIQVTNMKKSTNQSITSQIIGAVYNNELDTLVSWATMNAKNSVDKDNRTLLCHAVIARNYPLAEWLLEHGYEPNFVDKLGWAPLHYAAQNYLIDFGRLLIFHGADLEAKDNHGNTPLWRATFSSQGKGDFIRLLLDNDANPENANSSGDLN
jgi:ankyrin repeat protein